MVYLTLEGVATHNLRPLIKAHGFFFFFNWDKLYCRSCLSAANKNKALFNFAMLSKLHNIVT